MPCAAMAHFTKLLFGIHLTLFPIQQNDPEGMAWIFREHQKEGNGTVWKQGQGRKEEGTFWKEGPSERYK